jgi:hypothetical protein
MSRKFLGFIKKGHITQSTINMLYSPQKVKTPMDFSPTPPVAPKQNHILCGLLLSDSITLLRFASLSRSCYVQWIQGVPPGHEHLNIGRIKLYSSMTFV